MTDEADNSSGGRSASTLLAFGLGVLVGRATSAPEPTTLLPATRPAPPAAAMGNPPQHGGRTYAAIGFGLVLTGVLYIVLRFASGRPPTEEKPLLGTSSIDEFGGIVYVTWVLVLQVATLAFLQASDRLHQWIALGVTTLIIFGVLIYADFRWDEFATPIGIIAAVLAALANGLTIFLSPQP